MPKGSEARDSFCRQVRARSAEHREAIKLLHPRGLASVSIGILRQELDSMVRVIFLLQQPEADRHRLLKASVAGERWTTTTSKGKVKNLTDREMVELAQRLQGWTKSVYSFGCAFIHLSNFHDYGAQDPVRALEPGELEAMLKHLREYHGGPCTDEPTLDDLMPLVPRVFEKIAGNLECYVKDLERL
jgi:hypothetical protein